MSRITLMFYWRDLWIGLYISHEYIYFCPFPCVVIRIRKKVSK